MNDQQATILVIDDNPRLHKVLSLLLQPEFFIHTALSGEEGLEKVDVISPDLILLDLNLPKMNGIEVLRKLIQRGQNIPVIIFTAYSSVDSAVKAIKLGAVDYIEKPFDNQKLKQTVKDCLIGKKISQSLSIKREIIGESLQIKKVWQLVEKYGPTDLPILLQGETGTGKELFAKAIHEISKRREEAFVPIDCSAIPESLVESEIFGYERGAFTGANISKPGRLDWADKGTLFLDDISNLPLLHQAKLLRVIQEREYVPLGARRPKTIDVHLISSTNIDLKEAVERGTFREDLYYRISGVCLRLPPLREREGDIELLIRHFIDKYSRKYNKPNIEVSDEAMRLLLSYRWPGNVRELEQTIGAIVVFVDRVVFAEHLPKNLQSKIFISTGTGDRQERIKLELSFDCDITQPIDLKKFKEKVSSEAERVIISEVKKKVSLNQTELSSFLGIDPKTLRSKDKEKSPNERTILVVDDQEGMRRILSKVLSGAGFAVKTANSAQEALSSIIADKIAISAAIIDFCLPDGNGLDLFLELRRQNRKLPCVLITSYGTNKLREKALKLGFRDYFDKPFHNHALVTAIKKAIESDYPQFGDYNR